MEHNSPLFDRGYLEELREYNKARHKQWVESTKKIHLNDEICHEIIDNYLLTGDTSLPVRLRICATPPPCNDGEKEITSHGRKWCKGRQLPLKSEQFKKIAEKITADLEESRKEQEKRMGMIPDDALKQLEKRLKQLKKDVPNIKELKDESSDLRPEIANKTDSDSDSGSSDEDVDRLTERLQKLQDDDLSPDRFMEKLKKKVPKNPKKAKKFLKKTSRDLQRKKIRNQLGSETLTITRQLSEHISDTTKYYTEQRQEIDTEDDEKEVERTGIDTQVNIALEKMTTVLSNIDSRLSQLETQTNTIDKKQDRVIELSEQMNIRQLKQYVDQWYESKWGVAKMILKSPLKAINIIMWKPAMNAFWIFFGRWAYLMWGLLMLILITIFVVTIFTMIKFYFPSMIIGLQEVGLYIWGATLRSGSVIAQSLKPWFGESTTLVLSGAKTVSLSALQTLWDWSIGWLVEIFKHVVNKAGGTLFSSWW